MCLDISLEQERQERTNSKFGIRNNDISIFPSVTARLLHRVAIRPALGQTVRYFNVLSGVKPYAYLSSFWDTRLEERSYRLSAGTQHNVQCSHISGLTRVTRRSLLPGHVLFLRPNVQADFRNRPGILFSNMQHRNFHCVSPPLLSSVGFALSGSE